MRCGEVNENGLPCIKKCMQFPEGDWDHGGGHVFADERTAEIFERGHFDAKAVISLQPFEGHLPEECPDPENCHLTSPYTK